MRRGFEISEGADSEEVLPKYTQVNSPGVEKKRPKASITIEKQSARRKTPFIRAARISALCHPYE
jgi:hypothetical protein